MADITKCANYQDCTKQNTCYRAQAEAYRYGQSYAAFYHKGEVCKDYIERK